MMNDGIRRTFPSIKPYLRQLEGAPSDLDAELGRLQRYGREGSFTYQPWADMEPRPYDAWAAKSDLVSWASGTRTRAIKEALVGQVTWLDTWRRATALGHLSEQLSLATQRWIRQEFDAGRRPQYLATAALHRTAFVGGCCLALGWDPLADGLFSEARHILSISGFRDANDECHPRAPFFVFQLVNEEQGHPLTALGSWATDEACYAEVLRRWREPDEAGLAPLMTRMLDRHTHEARPNGNKGWFDFPWLDEWYVPYEALAVLRLRQRRGLPIAALQSLPHPLFATPLGQLHADAPPYVDPVLDAVLARMRADGPDV